MDPFGDNFGSSSNNAGNDFLNQEQNEVAALENQLMGGETGTGDGMADFFAPATDTNTKETTKSRDSDIDIDCEDNIPQAVPNSFTDPNSISGFDALSSTPTNTTAAPLAFGSGMGGSINTTSNYDIKPEAESITLWKKEFAARVQELDEKEQTQMSDWEEKAKKELDDWRRRRQEALEKQRQVNLENEQSFIDERKSRSEQGGGDIDWTKVSNLCDFNMKSNKKSKDTTRMKSMFLQMKGDAAKNDKGLLNGF